MARWGGHISTIVVHYPRCSTGLMKRNAPKGLYSMNIHEMASFLLSG
ncbi:hypothetical protein ALQ08_04860 [Pseudomonas syringae pv. delphinii]|uniref:Uncharacterized protein n=1 Tax=Pseudomonas syringae pv. delphinii TaxID=192088 RepID=A0A0P9U4I2_9PSED|nr:hypothetical protein ALO72_101145 [Pseudomonas syringae pv. delphinii]RMP09500.1 hypothetical protein ALQ28_101306 [Pseudomonas syringae pv. delphinii]RMP19636.1 hypothetical protein ALQ27_101371 [Pseudomonas syringae pv. delphinii]RMQ17743.1 hypothetical protein ALQ08_04860 [Pseudomonas syringae pv. delphinii]